MIGFRLFTEESLKLFIRYIISFVCFFRYLQFNSLFKTVVTVAFVLFLREGPGALHHGNEPLIIAGAGLPHDRSTNTCRSNRRCTASSRRGPSTRTGTSWLYSWTWTWSWWRRGRRESVLFSEKLGLNHRPIIRWQGKVMYWMSLCATLNVHST